MGVLVCSPGDYQDGTAAYCFACTNIDGEQMYSVSQADVSSDAYGVSKAPAPAVIAGVGESSTPIFEPLEPRLPPVVEEPPRSAGWSLDTVVNLVSLLLILSLGCSMLVPLGEPHSEDGDTFFVGHGEWMHDSGAGNMQLIPCVTDFAEWTSKKITTLQRDRLGNVLGLCFSVIDKDQGRISAVHPFSATDCMAVAATMVASMWLMASFVRGSVSSTDPHIDNDEAGETIASAESSRMAIQRSIALLDLGPPDPEREQQWSPLTSEPGSSDHSPWQSEPGSSDDESPPPTPRTRRCTNIPAAMRWPFSDRVLMRRQLTTTSTPDGLAVGL
jgi:hypothetical protein